MMRLHQFGRCDVLAQGLLQLRDRVHLTIRRGQQIRCNGLQADHREMAVRVHETGDQRVPLEVVHHGTIALHAECFFLGSNELELAVLHRQRFHIGGAVVCNGDDGSPEVDGVGGRCRVGAACWSISTGSEQACGGQKCNACVLHRGVKVENDRRTIQTLNGAGLPRVLALCEEGGCPVPWTRRPPQCAPMAAR